MRRLLFGSALLLLLSSASAFAQQTTGNITGRVVDQQGAAVPGASITAKNPATGLSRTETSDAEGVYRVAALPVGIYEVVAELTGFSTISKQDVEVNVGQTVAIDFSMKVATIAETVTVTVSAIVATFMLKSIATVWPTLTSTSCFAMVEKPVSSATTS